MFLICVVGRDDRAVSGMSEYRGHIPGSSSNRQRGCSVAITGKAQKQGRVEADPVRKEEPYSSLPQPKYITINEYKSKYIYPASVKSGILRERRSCVCQWEGRNMSKARQAIPTVTFVDEYCQRYQDLFPDVRIGNT